MVGVKRSSFLTRPYEGCVVFQATLLLPLLIGCAGAGTPPEAPVCPTAIPTASAAAVIEILPPELSSDAPPPVPIGMEAFANQEVLSNASAAVRSEVSLSSVRVRSDGSTLRIEVDGLGEQAALARCEAVVRSGLQANAKEAPAGLREQRNSAYRRIAELEQSLSNVAASQSGPTDPDAYVSWAKEASSQLTASVGVPGALLDRYEARTLNAIQERLAEAMQNHAQLVASGRGPRHPDVAEAERRRTALESWFLKQKQQEAEALNAIVAAWDKEEKRRVPEPLAWQRAFARASLAYLEKASDAGAVAFVAPVRLRLAAYEAAVLAIEEATLDSNYGPKHPKRFVLRVHAISARDQFERERALEVERLRRRIGELEQVRQATKAPAPIDERTEMLRKEREHLVGVILELDRRQMEAERAAPRMRVRDVCAPVPDGRP